MSTINYTYNVIVDRFRQFSDGHFQLRRFTHGEISQADLEKEAEWPWMHVKPRAINYSPGTRAFSFEIFISDLPRDKEDKTGYQAESITDCSLIFQDLINEIHLGNMFGDDVVLTRPVNSEPFVEQYTHTLTGVTGIIELSLDYDWSACSIPASWNYNTPTNSNSSGFGSLQFIESLEQNGVFVSLDNDLEAPGNSYYYGTNGAGVKGWYASQAGTVTSVGLTAGTGISVSGGPITSSGSITVTNSAPDQVVALTAGTGITTSGTYPNFTITNSAPSSGGTVTSVAALTLGTTGTDLSSTVATGTTTPVITLNVPTASAANRGALSSADWTTFNGKQAALGFTPENAANKQNSLAVDGTGVKFPTVDAVNTQSMIDKGRKMLSYFFDFIGPVATLDGLQTSVSGGSVNQIAGGSIPQKTVNQQGVVFYTTSALAVNYAYHINNVNIQLSFGGGVWNFETSINISVLSNATDRYRTIHGFGSIGGNVNAVEADGVFLTYDEGATLNGTAASPNWQCVTVANSVRTLTTTTTPVTAGAWHKLRIEVNATGTSAAFYLNGTLLATHTTNIPTFANTRYFIVKQGIAKTAGLTARTMFCDYIGYENILTTSR